mgnify:CR=1 FL=1
MGMFDEIIVGKSYLRGLLKKKDEKLFETNHVFQTKDLDNTLDLYRVYRQRLQKQDRNPEVKKWENVNVNVEVEFRDIINDIKGDHYSAAFKFSFKKGKLDKKELLSLKLDMTAKDKEEAAKMWDTEQEIFDDYRKHSFKYRFFVRVENCFQKITNWARNKHSLPLELRKEAYKKSGRLKKDPKCLELYKDL